MRHPHATVLHHGQKPRASFTGRIYARNLTLDRKRLATGRSPYTPYESTLRVLVVNAFDEPLKLISKVGFAAEILDPVVEILLDPLTRVSQAWICLDDFR